MFKEELKSQIIKSISTRFFLTLLNILASCYLVYNGKITSGDFATIIISITALYIAGRSATGILGIKYNGGNSNGKQEK